MSERRYLSPETLPAPFGYSHVVDAPAARMIYISGQVPLDPSGKLVGAGDLEAQTRQVFANLTAALEAAGARWSDVVKLNYYVRDVSQIGVVRTLRDEYIDAERRPASTLVEVSRLAIPGAKIEVEAVAILPER